LSPPGGEATGPTPVHPRLRWRCRRGTKELDVLLERFVTLHYVHASAAQREAFEELLELPDPELSDYLFGHALPAKPSLADIVALVASDNC
jgi:antitoxin CptB